MQVKRQSIRSFGNFHSDGIVNTLMRVVLSEFDPKPSGLDSDRRVALRIEACGPSQDLGSDLIFLQGDTRVIERVLGKIAEQFAKRFRAMQDMTFCKSIYLLEALLSANRQWVCDSHITWDVTAGVTSL